MPDWSYHILFKPILSSLSPHHSREFIHKGMNRISSAPGGHHLINFLGREESSPLLAKEVDQIHFRNSIGFSGKVDPLLSGTKAFSNLGFGFIEIGPVTTEPNNNGEPPIVHLKENYIEFSQNFESVGLEKTIEQLKQFKRKQPVFIRIAGNEKDQQGIINALEKYADAFIIEFSFNRVVDPSVTDKLVYIAIKPNQLNKEVVKSIKKMYSGIVLDEIGNIGDELNLEEHLKAINVLKEQDYKKTIITVGGVREPADALQLINAKVDLLMLSGGYVFSGPGLTKRIKEVQLSQVHDCERPQSGWMWYFLFGLSIVIGGLITLLISMSSIILPYDEYFLEMNRETIYVFNERILYFMAHDRMTLAGTMISGGIVYMGLARYGIRQGLKWAKQATDTAAIIGFLGIFLFIGYGYFDWLHLIFWLVLLPFYLVGFVKTKKVNGTAKSTNQRNHVIWKKSLFGQFALVILGFSFVFGGLTIAYIGITNVFIATDLTYICMPPEMLNKFNERLIPVIAHDRAGFGGALLSVGLLILMIALWGFQQGNKWVWWMLFLGGIPAFTAGIGVHFAIGYTDFIHLLPAYFALLLYVLGLVFSYSFFHLQNENSKPPHLHSTSR
ncbi:dihydroorotate dehydrogenase [Alkalihalobacterium elongatum]|uniref:dihydroorotate dehydrogenase n=1 Tax=Alkalihalobacterium elongatum TaxID=2675466 RepID=UPI001C1F6FD0|nr:dihydroorotate dehydrogenase [Alkalihalobacterium elongatum]